MDKFYSFVEGMAVADKSALGRAQLASPSPAGVFLQTKRG